MAHRPRGCVRGGEPAPLQLFMTADAVGGVWTYALELADGLAAHDVETTLAVLGPRPSADQLAVASRVHRLTVLETGLPLDWTAASTAEVEAAADAVVGLAADFKADVVHLNTPALAAFAAFDAPVAAACHSCVATWWDAVKSGPLPEDFAWRTELAARGYRAADRLVAPTAAFAAATQTRYGLSEAPQVVHNGRAFTPAEMVPSPEEPFVFTAGRLWDEAKGLACLDQAAALVEAPVFAAGALEGPGGASAAVRHVRSLGSLTSQQVAGWLDRSAVFVSAALYEPFGLSILEAARRGVPLVLSDIPTLRELWDGAALFAPPNEPAAFADAINCLLGSDSERARLAQTALERATTYGVSAMAAGMLAIYRDLNPASQRVSP